MHATGDIKGYLVNHHVWENCPELVSVLVLIAGLVLIENINREEAPLHSSQVLWSHKLRNSTKHVGEFWRGPQRQDDEASFEHVVNDLGIVEIDFLVVLEKQLFIDWLEKSVEIAVIDLISTLGFEFNVQGRKTNQRRNASCNGGVWSDGVLVGFIDRSVEGESNRNRTGFFFFF